MEGSGVMKGLVGVLVGGFDGRGVTRVGSTVGPSLGAVGWSEIRVGALVGAFVGFGFLVGFL